MTVIATAMLNENDRDPVNLGTKAIMKQNWTIPESPIQKLRILKPRKIDLSENTASDTSVSEDHPTNP